jgi:hypothetical protein
LNLLLDQATAEGAGHIMRKKDQFNGSRSYSAVGSVRSSPIGTLHDFVVYDENRTPFPFGWEMQAT